MISTAGTATSLTRVESVALQAKGGSQIKVRVGYSDSDGTTRYHTRPHTFDADLIAELGVPENDFDPS